MSQSVSFYLSRDSGQRAEHRLVDILTEVCRIVEYYNSVGKPMCPGRCLGTWAASRAKLFQHRPSTLPAGRTRPDGQDSEFDMAQHPELQVSLACSPLARGGSMVLEGRPITDPQS